MGSASTTPAVTARPLVIFDGDCAFCTSSVDFIRDRIRPDIDFAPWQRLDLVALGLTRHQVEKAVQWIDGAGSRASGARAFALLLRRASRPWRAVGALMLIPPINWLAAALYRLIADNRHRLPGGTPACALPAPKHDQGQTA
ncbi:thiol-disulfide oxidoreductase DCC family protein [Nocardia sp. NPDC006044]|uniref:thiol-disulfide oxidoreductase DCC family protein n=1 Tax=Nocardia sp. NPDC006044 TaxID=3364306 RepID=UPI0036A837AE